MALGGGSFMAQNKILPGTYINFVNASRAATNVSERGIIAMPLNLDWGPDGEVFEMTQEEFLKNAKVIFGYDSEHEKLLNIREMFLHAKVIFGYRVNAGVKASNTFCTAKNSGIRGNDLKIVIVTNVDDEAKFDVKTLIDNIVFDSQTISTAADLKENDFVTFKADAEIVATAGISLTGGSNAISVTGQEYADFLNKIESYAFNALGCPTEDVDTINLFVAFTKRLRDEMGIKFQTIVPMSEANVDHEGVIEVANTAKNVTDKGALIYWVTGAEGACAVNATLTNRIYNGEYEVLADFSLIELENFLKSGKLVLHRSGRDVRVMEDINTFVSITAEKGNEFGDNQTIRVLDQIANDVARIFNGKYMGMIPNNEGGRISLWNDIVRNHQQLEKIEAIRGFDPALVKIEAGEGKRSVVISDAITPMNCMAQLYMTVVVS